MKRMYVQAYCQSNLGDDLFVLHLARRYPETEFYLYAVGDNQKAFLSQSNLRLPRAWDRLRRKGRHMLGLGAEPFDGQGLDGTVVIGGSILWEGASLDFSGAPCFLIGPNCETEYSPAFRQRLEQALRNVRSCCFRDRASFEQFSQLPNVTWAPDVLFGYDAALPYQRGRGIGISLVSRKGAFRDDGLREIYCNAIADLCQRCLEEKIPLRLLSFCATEGDEAMVEAVLARVSNPASIAVSCYRGNPGTFLAEMNECETIIATRFHAMILGWVLGKNVVPIVYSTKQTQVLADCGFQGPMWNALEAASMTGETLLEYVKSERGRLDIAELKKRSGAQFAALDEYLK